MGCRAVPMMLSRRCENDVDGAADDVDGSRCEENAAPRPQSLLRKEDAIKGEAMVEDKEEDVYNR